MKIASVASHQRQGIRLGILVAASVVFGEHRILEHVYETKEEHRIKELAAILKDGHFPDYTTRAAPTVTHHDPFKHQEDKLKHAKKGDSIPTDMLMKAYLEGNDQYTSQGTGQSNKNDTQPSKSPVDKKTASPKSTPSPKTSRPTSSSSPTEMDKGKKDKKGSKGKSSDSSEDASPSKTPKGMKNKPSAPSTSPRPLASVTLAPASNNTTGVTNQTISPGSKYSKVS